MESLVNLMQMQPELNHSDLLFEPNVAPQVIIFVPIFGRHMLIAEQASVFQNQAANCPQVYQASTLNAIPATSSLLSKCKLPFGLVISPFRNPSAQEVFSMANV